MPVTKRKLIEVALPLEAINRESAREKSIRHGHPSTLHLWWARRPLAAARAVLFAQLVDDPSSHPDRFPTEDDQRRERERLHELIQRMVPWESSVDESLMGEARAEICDSVGDNVPLVDPFAGGGSIPLEAKRLGLLAEANDLNPLPVLINTVMLELVDRFAVEAPVSGGLPRPQAACLAADLLHYAGRLERLAEEAAGSLYPAAATGADALVYFWARTVTCPNPACRAEVPLVGSWTASSRARHTAHFRPIYDAASKVFDVEIVAGLAGQPPGTMSRTGGVCPACSGSFALDYVKAEGRQGRLGARLLALQQRQGRARSFVPADETQRAAAAVVRPEVDWLEPELSTHSQYMSPPRYGMTKFQDLFSARQLTMLTAFIDQLDAVQEQALRDAEASAALPSTDVRTYADGGAGPDAYAEAVRILLSVGLGRLVNRQSTLCIWNAPRQTVEQVFARQAYSMTWLYAEANPFAGASGSFSGQIEFLAKALAALPSGHGQVTQGPAQRISLPENCVISTDPPYYDMVPYADLSDFFLVWLRRMLAGTLPIFPTVLSPKADELVADHVRFGGKDRARDFFEHGLEEVFTHAARAHRDDVPMTVYYAYKQALEARRSSSGDAWSTMLGALLRAGWAVVGTWPVRTEQAGGLRELGRGALASSVVVVCRKRAADAPTTSRQGFLSALRDELPVAVRVLQQGQIAPVDQGQSTVGPGMAIFSRFGRVLEADGSVMAVSTALDLINQVLDEVINEQEVDFDATTRFAIAWYRHAGYGVGRFGDADNLARSRATSVDAMSREGVLARTGERVSLIKPTDLPADYDVLADLHTSAWEALHHLIRILDSEDGGITPAGDFLRTAVSRPDGAVEADLVKELAHLLFRVAEDAGRTKDALAFNNLVTSWPDVVAVSRQTPAVGGSTQTALDFEEDDET